MAKSRNHQPVITEPHSGPPVGDSGFSSVTHGRLTGHKFGSFEDFVTGCNQAAAAGCVLHSWRPILRQGALSPEVYALFVIVKE